MPKSSWRSQSGLREQTPNVLLVPTVTRFSSGGKVSVLEDINSAHPPQQLATSL